MKKTAAFLLITIIFIAGCSALRDFANIQQPSVDFNRVSIQSISFDGIDLLFDFEVNNPNQVGVDASEYSYEFFINDNWCAGNGALRPEWYVSNELIC